MAKKKSGGGTHEPYESPRKEAREEGKASQGGKKDAGLPGGPPPQKPGERIKAPRVN